MDSKLRSEVMDDIEDLSDGPYAYMAEMGTRLQQVMTDYEHLELQMLQAKRIIGGMVILTETHRHSYRCGVRPDVGGERLRGGQRWKRYLTMTLTPASVSVTGEG